MTDTNDIFMQDGKGEDISDLQLRYRFIIKVIASEYTSRSSFCRELVVS